MKSTCSVLDCERPHKGRGLCDMHLQRLRRTGTTESPVRSLTERFWEKVDKRGPGVCWLWQAALNDHGYGVIRPSGKRTGPALKAHRVSAELAGIPIEGLMVLHSCDTPACVNPAHLRAGTNLENVDDKVSRNRQGRGSQIATARLTENRVRQIRTLLLSGVAHQEIAEQFSVSRPTISYIASGKTWKHVTPPAARDLGAVCMESLGQEAVMA